MVVWVLIYLEGHKSQLDTKLKEYSPFLNHYEIFRDSLTKDTTDYEMLTYGVSFNYFSNYLSRLKKKLHTVSSEAGDGMINTLSFHSTSIT